MKELRKVGKETRREEKGKKRKSWKKKEIENQKKK